ncbi:MAG: hypothetical protein HY098_04935 [Nitrospinae bacterium]|nr:hypothetical protein [Nitrospinota bacterium]
MTRRTAAVVLAMAALAFLSCGGGGGGGGGNKAGGPTLSGVARFEKLAYDQNGLTGAVTDFPIRFAKADVVQNGSVVASTATDADGNYSFSSPGLSGTFYVRVNADAAPPFFASVVDASSAVFSVRSSDTPLTAGGSITLNLLASNTDVGPAFNIFDNLIRAQDADNSLAGRYPKKITAVWYSGNTSGTFYNSSTGDITILGALTDAAGGSDAYDDAVILHEMGHYAAANFSRDDSPGGDHSALGHYPDLRLTWSEGWATFFSCMSRSLRPITGALVGPQWYVDTPGWPGLAGNSFSFEIDTPTFSSVATGADNEQAVSNVLWHVFAASAAPATSPTSPYLGLGATDIWSVFSTYLPTVQNLSPSEYVTLESFWDGWVAKYPQQESPLTPILFDRKIAYSADPYEPDDTIAQARLVPVGTSENHTFFKSGAAPNGDKDYLKINVASGRQYTFATSVSNGADTLLTLLDSDGATMLAQNDDVSAADKGSKIVWTASATKTVYLLCEPYRPYVPADIFLYGGAGGSSPAVTRYGAYSITITSP